MEFLSYKTAFLDIMTHLCTFFENRFEILMKNAIRDCWKNSRNGSKLYGSNLVYKKGEANELKAVTLWNVLSLLTFSSSRVCWQRSKGMEEAWQIRLGCYFSMIDHKWITRYCLAYDGSGSYKKWPFLTGRYILPSLLLMHCSLQLTYSRFFYVNEIKTCG